VSKGARLPEGPPYVGLLKEDEAFLRWYLNVRRGSENTAAGYLRKMGNICAEHGINPKDLAKLSPVELNTFIGGLISAREEAGQRGSAIKSYVKALKSWLRFNAIKLELEPKLREDTPKYVDEKVFTRQQLASVLDHAGIREKVSISLIGFGGVRPATIGDATGTDGLKVHDFPELRIDAEKRKVEFEKVPTAVVVRRAVSKSRSAYTTFLPAQACEYVKQYLEDRMERGERLTPDSAVVTVTASNAAKEASRPLNHQKPYGEHITSTNIRNSIRKVIREAGFDWRPYLLRRYADTRMMHAEADGLIIRDWRQFWMGHSGDIEFVYTLQKGLDDDTLERMRDAYQKATNRYLVTSAEGTEEDLVTKIRKQILLTVYDQADVEKMRINDKSDEDVMALIREKLVAGIIGDAAQKVVKPDEVEQWLTKGWKWTGNLSDGRAVLEPAAR